METGAWLTPLNITLPPRSVRALCPRMEADLAVGEMTPRESVAVTRERGPGSSSGKQGCFEAGASSLFL